MSNSIKSSVQYLKNDQALAVYKASVAGGELVPQLILIVRVFDW